MTDQFAKPGTVSVALSMLTLVPGGMGGSETYARELARQLVTSPRVELTSFLPRAAAGFTGGGTEQVIEHLRAGSSQADRLRVAASLARRTPELRRAMAQSQIVHYPFTVPLPYPSPRQAVVQSLLDVQHLELPHMFSRAERAYRRVFYEGFAKRADSVVTISNFAKQRMVDLLGIDEQRIHVAHLGVDVSQFVPNDGPRKDFVLYPARGWPHKNHRRLVDAMVLVRRTNPGLRLVLTGGGLDALGELPDWVDRKGLVSGAELRDLYREASAMIFPSLYEGFGLPPLEAMASGCPVAVSNVGSLPEVVGDSAIQFDPHDVEAIAHGIQTVLETPQLGEAGVRHAATFTWERCLDAHLAAYDAALRRRQ